VARVNGVNSGALYINETGNMTGYDKITLPPGHTWQSFTNMLLKTLPPKTRDHYAERLKKFMQGWFRRGYVEIPQEAPLQLEARQWAPSWRRMAKCLLRNDYWCKGLGQTQPKSAAWLRFKEMKRANNQQIKNMDNSVDLFIDVKDEPA
jgi:predicted phosphoadenosine phosphosulfate sulfurtransferase